MNIREAKRHIQANCLAGNATLLKGPPGMAKSQIQPALAMWWKTYVQSIKPGARVGMAVCFLATASPISATGISWRTTKTWENPVTGEPVTYTMTDPAIPQWYMAVCLDTGEMAPASTFDSVYLVLEEWGQGSAEAKRAFAEVFRFGGTPPYYLPVGQLGSPRVACSNIDARDGVTKEFDFIINGVSTLIVSPSTQVWLEDFAALPYQHAGRTWMVSDICKTWAHHNPTLLFEPKPKEQGPFSSPRSVTMQDRYLQTITELNGGIVPLDDPGLTETCAGYTGMTQTQSILTTYKFKLELPSYEDVVKDPMGTPVPVGADKMMLMAYELAGLCQRNHVKQVLQYMEKKDTSGHGMPRDCNITFVSTIIRHDPTLLNTPAMDEWISKHAYLMGIIGKLARN